jgi:hypothetical protein
MNSYSSSSVCSELISASLMFALFLMASILVSAQTTVSLTRISSDPFSVGPGQHATEVEPHVLAFGSTLVAAFQTGRIVNGGGTDIGWATSTNGGTSWSHGFLPGLTKGEGTGPYDAASDPAVAYDAKHGVWMIASLPISNTSQTPAVVVSRSADGGFTWEKPVSVNPKAPSSDKNWIACDSWSASPYYGNCYMEWDDPNTGEILMSRSTDGGLTWSLAIGTVNQASGIGGQPLVQPNGTVVVPIESNFMSSFTSTNGGASWSGLTAIAVIQSHTDAAGIRSGPLPSAAVDGAGKIWVVWEDCRFRAQCATNDLVYSTSTDGTHWSKVTRVPIDPVTSVVDHFIPGVGIDPATSGATAHVGIHYYYYGQSNCTVLSCRLYVGYISSPNGGATWSPHVRLAGPATLNLLPNSQNGLMVGDYIATAFTNGVPHGVFAVARAKTGTAYNEAMFTAQGLSVPSEGAVLSSAGDKPLHNLSDKVEKEHPEKGAIPLVRRAAKKSVK